MATLEFGPLITNARGSIKGTTFSRVISGATARGRPRPPKPNSASQRLQQTSLQLAASLWRTISSAQRGDWTGYASSVTLFNRLGQAFNPTGQQMFVRNLVHQLNYDPTSLTLTAPTSAGLPAQHLPVTNISGDDLIFGAFSLTPPPATTTYVMSIYVPSIKPATPRFIQTARVTFDDSIINGTILIPDYYAAFAPGDTVWHLFRVSQRDPEGRVSNPDLGTETRTVT